MNILPKKRWHVRTRENITRVRRDEAAAAEEEKKRIQKIELAEKEARTEVLRAKAREKYGFVPKKEEKKEEVPIIGERGHVNLFYELESNDSASNKKNVDHEKEEKAEREKEEMKIGYLTYLGQETNELTGNVSWYNKPPVVRSYTDEREVGMKEKLNADPMKNMGISSYPVKRKPEPSVTAYLPLFPIKKEKKKKQKRSRSGSDDDLRARKKKSKKRSRSSTDEDVRRKRKKSKSSSSEKKKKKRKKKKAKSSSDEDDIAPRQSSNINIEKLRMERLLREKAEQKRTAALFAKLRGEESPPKEKPPVPEIVQKYNSQFNPMLARQNYPPEY